MEAGSKQWGSLLAVGAGITHGVLAAPSGSQSFKDLDCTGFIPDDSQQKQLEILLFLPLPPIFLFHYLQFCVFK